MNIHAYQARTVQSAPLQLTGSRRNAIEKLQQDGELAVRVPSLSHLSEVGFSTEKTRAVIPGEQRETQNPGGITRGRCVKILDTRLRGYDERASPDGWKPHANWDVDEKPTPMSVSFLRH